MMSFLGGGGLFSLYAPLMSCHLCLFVITVHVCVYFQGGQDLLQGKEHMVSFRNCVFLDGIVLPKHLLSQGIQYSLFLKILTAQCTPSNKIVQRLRHRLVLYLLPSSGRALTCSVCQYLPFLVFCR